ncbi:hypothetical protein ACJMK2_017421 [Sinanodonta woodiana]|uniref:S-formylglutathione hydrolase n=1 Tax=Sinanodonta woodiana TaxID=1069815 RepID=A0ABD3UAB0_SINWO
MASSEVTQVSTNKMFGGYQKVYSHESKETKCTMKFGIYLPPQSEEGKKLPVLYWLSGLTCTEQNFITKAGAQKAAAEHGIIIVAPDTSPRGCNIEGETDSYDFGSGAGFYVDATEEKWKTNYRMYSYVTKEVNMGGHGALICALKNPGQYKSVSAFAPISNPCCKFSTITIKTIFYPGNVSLYYSQCCVECAAKIQPVKSSLYFSTNNAFSSSFITRLILLRVKAQNNVSE